jgi:hypothetical protein
MGAGIVCCMVGASWQGPPTDVLGTVVPVQQFVARTDHAVVALQHLIALPEGCILSLRLAVRRGSLDESAWNDVLGTASVGHPDLTAPEEGLTFGVRFPDGSRATTVEHSIKGWAPRSDRPERPMLVEIGSESSSDDQYFNGRQELWIWPLPPLGPFEFVVEWQSLGLDLTSHTLDGSAVVRAAEDARPFWL